MSGFYFDHHTLSALAQLALTMGISFYLLKLRGKTAATRWFQLFFATMMLYAGLSVIEAGSLWTLRFYAVHLQLVALALALSALLQFAYRFPAPPEEEFPRSDRVEREARLGLWLSLLAAGGTLAWALYQFAQLTPTGFPSTTTRFAEGWLVVGLGWVLLIFGRRSWTLSRQACPTYPGWRHFLTPQGRAARAAWAFALTFFLSTVLAALLALSGTLNMFPRGAILNWVPGAGVLINLFGIALVFFSNTTERTSVMAKIGGSFLVTMLLGFGLVGAVIAPPHQSAFAMQLPELPARTFRFTPTPDGRYTLTTVPARFDTDWGERRAKGDATLPFTFPFFGQPHTGLYLDDNGTLILGTYNRWAARYNLRPAIFALDRGGGALFVKVEAARYTVTWERPAAQGNPPVQAQGVLFPDGSFELRYKPLHAGDITRAGIQAGNGSAHIQPLDLSRAYTGEQVAGDGMFADTRLLERQFLDARLRPLVWLLVGSSFLILLVFPRFFRQVLIGPLEELVQGVQAVNAGNLQVEVPVRFPDELGLVSETFNRMVASVRGSDARLEGLVAARTEALVASEARYRELFDTMTSGVAVLEPVRDGDDFVVREFNRAGARIEGIARDAVRGKRLGEAPPFVANPALAELVQRAWEAAPLAPVPSVQYQVAGGWREGGAYKLPSGEVVVVFDDVTARVEAQARQRQIAALEEREQLGRDLHDDLGQVLGFVSVQSQAARALLDAGEIARAQATLDRLVQAAQAAHAEVRQFILGIRSAPSDVAFFAALERYLYSLRDAHGMEVQLSVPDDWGTSPLAPKVEGQLLRILQEALANVRKHATRPVAQVVFTGYRDEVQVMVSDDGPGFDPDRQRADAPHFGLSIMRERAEGVGGSLEVRARPGTGTRLIVRLPRARQRSGLAGTRVLLVDDHQLYLEGLRTLLAVRGMQVVGIAHDGVEAQERTRALRPDLILMDLHMPRCDGLEATRRIKAEMPEIKIVILTVAAEGALLLEALDAGAAGYLLKSLDANEFYRLLSSVLAGETALAPSLAARLLTEAAQAPPTSDVVVPLPLTSRQIEVLGQVAAGRSNREIADALHITESTVKYHVSEMLTKLELSNRHALAEVARQQGLMVR